MSSTLPAAPSMSRGGVARTSCAERSTERGRPPRSGGDGFGSGPTAALGGEVEAGAPAESSAADGALRGSEDLVGLESPPPESEAPEPPESPAPESPEPEGTLSTTPPPPAPESSLPFGTDTAMPTTSSTEAATPSAGRGMRGHLMPRLVSVARVRGKPRSARQSSERVKTGPGAGRSSRRATASSARSARSGSTGRPASASSSAASSRVRVSGVLIDGLSQLLDGAVQEGAGVRDGDAEDGGELGVVEPGVELEADQLALARRQPGERGPQRRAAQRRVGGVLRGNRIDVGGVGRQRRGA